MGLLSRLAKMGGRGAVRAAPKPRGPQHVMADIADVDNQLKALREYEIDPQPALYGARPNPMADARELAIVQRQMREMSAQRRALLEELRSMGVGVNPNAF